MEQNKKKMKQDLAQEMKQNNTEMKRDLTTDITGVAQHMEQTHKTVEQMPKFSKRTLN